MEPFERDKITLSNLFEAYEINIKFYEGFGDDKVLDAIEVLIPYFGNSHDIMKLEILKESRKNKVNDKGIQENSI